MRVALKGQARAVEHGRARHRIAFLGLAGLTALGDINRAESRAASSGTESLNGCCAQILLKNSNFRGNHNSEGRWQS